MNQANSAPPMIDTILSCVAQHIQVDPNTLSPHGDLFAAGLDSLALMSLVARWRALGHAVDFASLAQNPRAHYWATLLNTTAPLYAKRRDSGPKAPDHSGAQRADQAFALAPMQYAYWLGRDPNQPLGGVAAHLYCEFQQAEGAPGVDVQRLQRALQVLCERHSSLRMQVTENGEQRHLPSSPEDRLYVHDLRELSRESAADKLEKLRQRYASQMLAIEAGEVFAAALSLLPDGGSRLHLDVDMIAGDAVSYRVLLRELALLYRDPQTPLAPLPMSYRDCRLASEARWPQIQREAGSWWQQRLDSLPSGPQLPLNPRDSQRQAQTTRRHFHLNAEARDALYGACRQRGLTPAAVLATAFAETLAGWCASAHFLLNVPLFLRPMEGPDVSAVVGDFSSSILLEVDLRQARPFGEQARQLQTQMHRDAAHAEYGGVQVLRDLGRQRGEQFSAPVVFTSALNLGELFDSAVREVFGAPIWIISQGPQVLLDTQITELDGGLLINWDCREEAVVAGVLDGMFAFFRDSVQQLAGSEDVWSQSLAAHLPAERTVASRASAHSQPAEVASATAPQDPVQQTVAMVWCEVLGGGDTAAADTDIHQNLFAAGGDSMLANSLVAQLREIFGVHTMDIRQLFQGPSIAGLSATIVERGGEEAMLQIAQVYQEILHMDDAELMAELAGEAQA